MRYKRPPHVLASTSGLLLFLLVTHGLGQTPAVRLSGLCKDRCDKERSNANHGAAPFDFTCNDESCFDECESCPREVCDETTSDREPWRNWHCPLDNKYLGACKRECDLARTGHFADSDEHKLNDFTFQCGIGYFHPTESRCQEVCRENCPRSVCDASKNSRNYQCPAANGWDLTGKCLAFCRKHRYGFTDPGVIVNCYGLQSYNYDTSMYPTVKDYCVDSCSDCQTPEGENYVCNSANPEYFYCPWVPPEKRKRTYKGPCKDRCDGGQGGGPHPYTINCETNYETQDEKRLCIQTCQKECLTDMCNIIGNDSTINCRGNKKGLEKLEEERRRKEKQREDYRNMQKGETGSLKLSLEENEGWAYAMGAFLAIFIIVWICTCCCLKRRRVAYSTPAPVAQVMTPVSTTPIMQQQPMTPMPQQQQSGLAGNYAMQYKAGPEVASAGDGPTA